MPVVTLRDLERRALAHSSIPRNLTDLYTELVRDEGSPVGPGQDPDDYAAGEALETMQELGDLVGTLEAEGWLVRFDPVDDHVELAAKIADGHKGSLPTGDEKARLYAERLAVPGRNWRARGDLWMITEDGLEKLRQPGPAGPGGRMNLGRLYDTIHAHAAEVVREGFEGSIYDQESVPGDGTGGGLYTGTKPLARGHTRPDGTRVATLLPEEFEAWFETVTSDFLASLPEGEREQARRQLDQARRPIAGGAGYGNATEDLIQDADKGGTAYGETAPTFVALSILAFSDTDTGTTADDGSHKPNYTGYARISSASADFGASSAGTRSNANALIGAACTAGTSTIVGMARCTAATLGRLIRYATTASTVVSTTQTPPQFAAGALVDTLD